jgi:hypothetical protein
MGLSACGDYPTPFKGRPGAEAERLSQPTAPLLVIAPPDAPSIPPDARQALAEALAKALQEHEVPAQAKRPTSADWRLVSRLEARGGTVVPMFNIEDPAGKSQGNAEGAPESADAWAVGSPDLLKRVAVDAAPRLLDLLTGIRITRDRANPNSLLNRPARAMVAEVTGAPGDGNSALTRNVREHLKAYGVLVQIDKTGADFLVKGEVTVTPTANQKERVEIVWSVSVPSGDERGKVVQLNEIPAGTLSHYWGDVAVVVATEAAGGLHDVIDRQSGRTDAAEAVAKAAGKQPPAAH